MYIFYTSGSLNSATLKCYPSNMYTNQLDTNIIKVDLARSGAWEKDGDRKCDKIFKLRISKKIPVGLQLFLFVLFISCLVFIINITI